MNPSEPKARINKILVELGLADSRRKADELISSGVVTINGEIARVGDLVSHNRCV